MAPGWLVVLAWLSLAAAFANAALTAADVWALPQPALARTRSAPQWPTPTAMLAHPGFSGRLP